MIARRHVAALAAVVAGIVDAGVANAATAVSSNWSGYAVTGATYTSVTGTWTEPTADCSTSGSVTASAFWVGLGGDASRSEGLEQAGTEADCSASGTAHYTAWYELVPAASVRIGLSVSAGDRVSATVNVRRTTVIVAVDDLTTGKAVTKSLTMASPDVSSAEWIAEAPSVLTDMGTEVLPLTDFGSVPFSSARATTVSGATGAISDSAWTATRIELDTTGGGPGRVGGPVRQFAAQITAAQAVPSTLGHSGSSFSVTWKSAASSTRADVPGQTSFGAFVPAEPGARGLEDIRRAKGAPSSSPQRSDPR